MAFKGFLTFGLISIPVSLSPAARSERISFNQMHSVCRTRIKQPTYCPKCEKFVDRSEIEKGYEYEKDQYLLFTQAELEAVEPESARTMEILKFVKVDEIDPVYFDASYYATPESEGTLAYRLLVEAMLKTGYAGVAKVTMSGRENIMVLRARPSGLMMHTLFYANEVRTSEFTMPEKPAIKEAEAKLAMQLIDSLASNFDPKEFSDAYQEGLRKLIDAKAHGKKLVMMPKIQRPPSKDLMSALQESLAMKREPMLRVVKKRKVG
jgi:DNA end-binding protein Ku